MQISGLRRAFLCGRGPFRRACLETHEAHSDIQKCALGGHGAQGFLEVIVGYLPISALPLVS